eukprot:6181995-Pleurochrysis_carterae.AAC.4
MGSRLFKPPKVPRANAMPVFGPPGVVSVRTGDAKLKALELCFNMAVVDQARAGALSRILCSRRCIIVLFILLSSALAVV